ncbi:MAG: allophanate hydrolase subunit 1 [Actinomycetota bacterium]|nr:allophanate hydrolase subunit 1 [Actinomycetota bacterium]
MLVTIRPMGESALLVEADSLTDAVTVDGILRSAVRTGRLPAFTDQVAAARTVLLRPQPGTDLAVLRDLVAALCANDKPSAPTDSASSTELVIVPVRYHGADLANVAELTGLSVDRVIAAHTGSEWRVAFGGFAPGFAYLHGGDSRLQVPRRASPRTSIPAGSVGLAGEFSGVYPRSSPGGWQLIGTTELAMWDADREPPALLRPGCVVRFEAVEANG